MSAERVAEPHDRRIPDSVQKSVFARDNNTCRICGWEWSEWSQADARLLELHHLQAHEERGENVEENLVVVCNRCHDDIHADRLMSKVERLREEQCQMYSE